MRGRRSGQCARGATSVVLPAETAPSACCACPATSTALKHKGAAATLAGLHAPASRAQAPAPPYLADMHSHYGMFLPRLFGLDLARHMQETGTMLLAWSATELAIGAFMSVL